MANRETVASLLAQIAKLEARKSKVAAREQAFAEILQYANSLGFSPNDLHDHLEDLKESRSYAIIQCPFTGRTWKRTGRRPDFIRDLLAKGYDLEDLRVDENAPRRKKNS